MNIEQEASNFEVLYTMYGILKLNLGMVSGRK